MTRPTFKGCPPAPEGARGCPKCKVTLAAFEHGEREPLPCPWSPHSRESTLRHQSAVLHAIRERASAGPLDLNRLPCTLVALGLSAPLGLQLGACFAAVASGALTSRRANERLAHVHGGHHVTASSRLARHVFVSARRQLGLNVPRSGADLILLPTETIERIDLGIAGIFSPHGIEFPEDWGLVEVMRRA